MTNEDRLNEIPEQDISQSKLKSIVDHLGKILGSPHREYKDRVFRMLMKEPAVALEIYNAMNDTAYDDPDALQITTLENAIYMAMKNDASFILASQLLLYEHQSTLNPNLPLRDLFYVACVLSAITDSEALYRHRLVKIPEPKFVVFYNGVEEAPERFALRLSDAYEKKSDEIDLELKLTVLNINYGYNEALAAKSPTLHQYMIFVDTVRKFQDKMPFSDAVNNAVEFCIQHDILKNFLTKNKSEVLRMSIFEYDQEHHMELIRQDSWEDGFAFGEKKGKELGQKQGEEIGRKQGEETGRKLERMNFALKLSSMNFSEDQIANLVNEDVSVVRKWLEDTSVSPRK